MDAEPWGPDSKEVAEIGLSFIQPFDLTKIEQPPQTLQELQNHLSISTYSIKVCGREQGKRETFSHQTRILVKPEELENVLLEILLWFQDTLAAAAAKTSPTDDNSVPSLVLVGFDLAFEFWSLSTSYPRIADCLASWVDLQELVKDAAQLGKKSPSLRDSLTALGFGSIKSDVGLVYKKHSAGKDTLRITALLLALSLRDPDEGPLPLTFTYRRKWSPAKASRRYHSIGKLFNNQCPKPRELFPFAAKVAVCGGRPPLGKVNATNLMEIFAEYTPTAVGSYSDSNISDYICLPSFDALNQFVASVDGKVCEEYGGSWTAVSNFDPALTPARTTKELEEFNSAQLQATILEKRRLRQQKKRLEQQDASE